MSRYWVISPYDFKAPGEWERVWEYDLENGVISIGWRKLKDISALDVDQIAELHRRAFSRAKPGAAALEAHMLYKFWHDVDVGHTVIARRGRKVIAAVGVVTRRAYYDPSKNQHIYPQGNAYPNHIDVDWHAAPRELAFERQEFGMQTIHEISRSRFQELTGKLTRRQKATGIFPDDLPQNETFVEGAQKTTTINAYERDPRARDVCLSIHGVRCSACKMAFDEVYGEIGAGFIHVHHLNPLAARKGQYRLRPMTDLAPVCPNCHAMLHTSNPPLTIQQLKVIMRRQRRNRRRTMG